jgi:hypothetical protein
VGDTSAVPTSKIGKNKPQVNLFYEKFENN